MSADNVHADVKREFVKAKNVISVQNFADCVEKATTNSKVLQLNCHEFLNLKPRSSKRGLSKKRTKLAELLVIECRWSSDALQVKLESGGKFSEFDNLRRNFKQHPVVLDSVTSHYDSHRGIPMAKKEAIIRSVVPIIRAVDNGRHQKKARFFENLAVPDVTDFAAGDDETRIPLMSSMLFEENREQPPAKKI